MKKTVFYDFHIALKAKMAEFAGYMMPIEYSGINNEHMAVCENAGLFDVSHMGEIWVKGPKALPFLQKVTTNDVSKLFPGRVQYSCLPNGKGGIVDDILVYQFEAEKYFLVVNASNTDKVWVWLNSQNDMGAILENSSDSLSQLALQGPASYKILKSITLNNISDLKYYHFIVGEVAGIKNVIISNTGYTGAGGYELYFSNQDGIAILNALTSAGKEFGLLPVGLGARDTLRLEMGYSLYGHELSDSTSPIEAGLDWIVKLLPDKNLIDKMVYEKQHKEGTTRKLVAFEMTERSIPRHGYEICKSDGEIIGQVTSGTMSPVLKKGIGMGYVPSVISKPGDNLYIKIRDKLCPAKVVELPFVTRKPLQIT